MDEKRIEELINKAICAWFDKYAPLPVSQAPESGIRVERPFNKRMVKWRDGSDIHYENRKRHKMGALASSLKENTNNQRRIK